MTQYMERQFCALVEELRALRRKNASLERENDSLKRMEQIKVLNPTIDLNWERLNPFKVVVDGEIINLSDSRDREEETVENAPESVPGSGFIIEPFSIETQPIEGSSHATGEEIPQDETDNGEPNVDL
ncbi:hypothetical protein RJT34_11802 [Clitoria ternatea]|uniref:Uncharacterized protein n=1 Tax=Clitoria ternatea TaxID=43366 RepID=A0AAN9PKD2_CLITE